MALSNQDCLDIACGLLARFEGDVETKGFNRAPFTRLVAGIQIALQEAAAGLDLASVEKRLGINLKEVLAD